MIWLAASRMVHPKTQIDRLRHGRRNNRTLVYLRRIARRGIFVSAAMLAITFPVAATAADAAFCVRPVNVVAADNSADLERKLHSLVPLPKAPDSFNLSKGARYPLARHSHTVERLDGLKVNHSLYWTFSDNHELVGPRDFLGADGPVAVGRTGRSFLLGGAYEKTDSGNLSFQQLLLQQTDGGAIGEVDHDLQKQLGDTRLVAWSDILDGFVLSSIKWRENGAVGDGNAGRAFGYGAVGDERTSLLKGIALVKLPGAEVYPSVVADLPRLGATALLGGRTLTVITPQLQATEIAHLNPGDDFGGFEALYETRDDGWLYVVGGQYDNAVHVGQTDGKWRATTIVRIVGGEDNSSLDGLLRWIFGTTPDQIQRDKLSKVIHAGTCRRFSSAIKRMFYCGDSASTADIQHELRAGELVPIAGGTAGLRTFLGDADSLGLALFLGADRGLYGYDGERVHRIANADFESALVHDLPKLGRTLLVSPNALLEVRTKGDDYELVKLAAPGVSGLFVTRFLAAPDDKAVLAFAANGVYLLKDGALTLIWSSVEHGSINAYGGTPPTDVVGWGGILFTTHLRNDLHFYLLRPCSESTGDVHTR
jgi:hypothetical protein